MRKVAKSRKRKFGMPRPATWVRRHSLFGQSRESYVLLAISLARCCQEASRTRYWSHEPPLTHGQDAVGEAGRELGLVECAQDGEPL